MVDVYRRGVVSRLRIPYLLPDLLGTKLAYRPICWTRVRVRRGQRDGGGLGAPAGASARGPHPGGGWTNHPQRSRLECDSRQHGSWTPGAMGDRAGRPATAPGAGLRPGCARPIEVGGPARLDVLGPCFGLLRSQCDYCLSPTLRPGCQNWSVVDGHSLDWLWRWRWLGGNLA